ncbi:MAG: hypothetical protein COX30_04920 [Candidatus Moranbacteria bacterium CG23_combo_of_CG06-09_8_20_14_all_39_10]|nr:MAG: hypothetical protein COX30_04920 [Candidatus Moranbacteria bacterium CG23_combo_of_CG06-09_8_20_14_all_39_10]
MKIKGEIFGEYLDYYKGTITDYLMKFYFLWFLSIMIGVPSMIILAYPLRNSPFHSFFEVFYKIFDYAGGNIFGIWWIFLVLIFPLAWFTAEDSLARKFLKNNLEYKNIVTTSELSQYVYNTIFHQH